MVRPAVPFSGEDLDLSSLLDPIHFLPLPRFTLNVYPKNKIHVEKRPSYSSKCGFAVFCMIEH